MTSILDSPLPAGVAESVGRVSTLLTAAPLGVAFSGGVDSSTAATVCGNAWSRSLPHSRKRITCLGDDTSDAEASS
jgi:asparagine synthetase B (glutamine-hydrolysing)